MATSSRSLAVPPVNDSLFLLRTRPDAAPAAAPGADSSQHLVPSSSPFPMPSDPSQNLSGARLSPPPPTFLVLHRTGRACSPGAWWCASCAKVRPRRLTASPATLTGSRRCVVTSCPPSIRWTPASRQMLSATKTSTTALANPASTCTLQGLPQGLKLATTSRLNLRASVTASGRSLLSPASPTDTACDKMFGSPARDHWIVGLGTLRTLSTRQQAATHRSA